MISRFEQFAFIISGIHRCIQKIEKDEMIKLGYRGAFVQYLAVLNRFEDGLTSAQICEICDKDKAAVSRIVAELEEKGLAERGGSGKYRAKIVLTQKGKEIANFVAERAKLAVVAVSGEIMSEEQRDVFYTTLDALSKNLQKISEEGVPQK